jgi:hypothetical protein
VLAVLGADLHHDVVETGRLLRALVKLVLDVLLARQQPDYRFARHFLNLRRQRDLERIRKRHEQHVAHLPHRQHEIFLTKFLRNPLKCLRADAVMRDVER